ncbi:MAG: 50S ribosomal protein L23 [Syntrophales bacterium]|jgi:large subunit ribosomal protein L23|nr:50S ribosomal protein L23 [Syntrophales bacterium]
MDTHYIIKRSIVTEKSAAIKDERNQYMFEVDPRANKIEIGKAVEKLFKVKVLDVRTANVIGKKKRMGRIVGQKRSWKKAIVTLAPGSSIQIYEGV